MRSVRGRAAQRELEGEVPRLEPPAARCRWSTSTASPRSTGFIFGRNGNEEAGCGKNVAALLNECGSRSEAKTFFFRSLAPFSRQYLQSPVSSLAGAGSCAREGPRRPVLASFLDCGERTSIGMLSRRPLGEFPPPENPLRRKSTREKSNIDLCLARLRYHDQVFLNIVPF